MDRFIANLMIKGLMMMENRIKLLLQKIRPIRCWFCRVKEMCRRIKCVYCGQPIKKTDEVEYWEDSLVDADNAKYQGKPIHAECAKDWKILIRIEDNPNAPDTKVFLPTQKEMDELLDSESDEKKGD
jgi:hypothetical protein